MKESALNLIPFISQVLLSAPQLVTTIGGIFVQNGGTEEEYGIIREHARELASKLGHPDTYFVTTFDSFANSNPPSSNERTPKE